MAGLARFVEAQADAYEQALAELRAGAKRSHWMWFVFPQIAGLGRSPAARFYALADLAEARAYLADPVLGPRLFAATEAILAWSGTRSADAVLGAIDALKLRSSMTLFERAAAPDQEDARRFGAVLDAFYGAQRDPHTVALIEK